MTTQEKIDVLERAISKINFREAFGICYSLVHARGADSDFTDEICEFLPPEQYSNEYHWNTPTSQIFCWPASEEGDSQRREFLRSHIERLKKEL